MTQTQDSAVAIRKRRLRRSELATPASNERMIASAAAGDADLVFLDMEDAVAPSEKVSCRAKVSEAMRTLDWGGKVRAARINALSTPWGHDDVRHLIAECGNELDVIVVPKAETAADVHELEQLVTQLEREHGIEQPLGFEFLIEDVRALINCEQIATASPRMEAIIFGVGDLAASQGMRLFEFDGANDAFGGDPLAYARTKIVVAARAAGIDAIDCPFGNYNDPETYRIQAGRAAVLGAVGKWAIHPSQIPLAHAAFTPPAPQVARARRLIEAIAEAEAKGLGAVTVDGEMVDIASAKIMQSIVDFDDLIAARARAE
ncbi:CoA ester lyase [Conexibacter sp. CPCC 206217]|uniref:HpcH/HpaI aldolase/citrate lyase family protein n=1 Tax=Conexibacter sp. CPCC 206217 TaxID=3064574 RepID=UPI002715DE39|nr:CoA ester lyase [Conexibacter sp. CPCC 206217]MDO8212221.1 CoA ester lyase [Conexibacter sp. CPCC 206217]